MAEKSTFIDDDGSTETPDVAPKTPQVEKSTFVDDAPEFEMRDEDDDDAPVEEAPRRRSRREEPPPFDPVAAHASLTGFAKEAAQHEAMSEYQRINQELASLPRAPRTEEEFLQLTEQQKFALSQIESRRQNLLHYRDNVLPQATRLNTSEKVQMANQIVGIQQQLQTAHPERWAQVLGRAYALVGDPNSGIGANELANPSFYQLLDLTIAGEQMKQKEGRKRLRSMADRASVAGRGGSTGGGESAPLPPDAVKKFRAMGLNDDQIRRTVNRAQRG